MTEATKSNTAQCLLDVLTEHADDNGSVEVHLESTAAAALRTAMGNQKNYDSALAELVAAGLVHEGGNTLSLRKTTETAEKRKPKAVPTPTVPTREPTTQNQHMRCIRKMHTLSHAEFRVAVELHYIAYTHGGKAVCAQGFIYKATGVTNADRVARKLVEAGLFRRLDNGQGGRGGSNSATYVPLVPKWWK